MPGELNTGGVVARLGAKLDDAAFERYDRRLRDARQEASRPIEANLRGDYDGRGFDQYERSVRGAHRANDDFVRGSGRVRTSLGSLFIGGAGVAAGAAGFYALAKGAGAALSAFQESDQIARRTANVLKTTGGVAGVTAKEVSDLATAISKKTGVDDEAIQSGENLLLTFTNIRNETGKGNDIFTQATKTVTDMSAALGQDTSSSAIQLGKALNDPIKGVTALQRVGVSFTKDQKEQIKTLVEHGKTVDAQKLILRELGKEFGGAAEAADTGTKDLKVSIGNLEESIGRGLAPVLDGAAGGLSHFVDGMTEGTGAGGKFADIMRGVGGAIGDVADWIGGAFNTIRNAFSGGNSDATRLGQNFRQTFGAIITTVRNLGRGIARTFADVRPDLEDIGRGFLKVFRAIEDVIQPIVRAVLPGLSRAIQGIATIVRNVVKVIAGIFKGDFSQVFDGLGGIVRGAFNVVRGVLGAAVSGILTAAKKLGGAILHGVIDLVEDIPGKVGHWLGRLPGKIRSWAGSAYKAAGGIGSGIVHGILGGIASLAGDLVNAGKNLGKKLINAAKDFLGIKSPSQAFMEVGKNVVRGFAAGLDPGDVVNVAKKAFGSLPALAAKLIKAGVIDIGGLPIKGLNAIKNKLGGLASGIGGLVGGLFGGGGGGGETSTTGLVAQVVRALAWARAHGWRGGVTSGFRTYAEQAILYARYLNGTGNLAAPPGHSNHEGGQAIDVSDTEGFARAMASAPPNARLTRGIPGEPWHFSVTGHRTGGRVGPFAGGIHVRVAGEGNLDEWIISQEGDRQANIGYALEALRALGANVSLNALGYRPGNKARKAHTPKPKLAPTTNRGAAKSIQRGEDGIRPFEDAIQDLERRYDLFNRRADLDDNEFLVENDDGSVTIDTAGQRDREAELTGLSIIRTSIRRKIQDYRERVKSAIARYDNGIKVLKRALAAAKGKKHAKQRAGYRQKIADYVSRRGELKRVYSGLGFDLEDNAIDLDELHDELAAVTAGVGAHAAPPADPAPADNLPADASPSSSSSDDTTPTEPIQLPPDPAAIAAAAIAQVAAFQSSRADLFANFGSNFMAGGFGGDTAQAAGARYFGATGASQAFDSGAYSPVGQAGGEIPAGTVTVINNYAAPPPDPHTWSRDLEFELTTI